MTNRPILQRSSAFVHRSRGKYRHAALRLPERSTCRVASSSLSAGERLPNRVLLLLADELGWGTGDG